MNDYKVLKKIVNNTRTSDYKKVKVLLLQQLILNCFVKYKTQMLKYTCHEIALPFGQEEGKILDDILEEFTLVKPNVVLANIQNGGQSQYL